MDTVVFASWWVMAGCVAMLISTIHYPKTRDPYYWNPVEFIVLVVGLIALFPVMVGLIVEQEVEDFTWTY